MICAVSLHAQPTIKGSGVEFTYNDPTATSVSLVGDFNSWSSAADPMTNSGGGNWTVTVPLLAGTYQYAFLVDKQAVRIDPKNSFTYEAVDGSGTNSLVTISAERKIVAVGYPVWRPLDDTYQRKGGTVYLNFIFKHHLPLYYDAAKDCIDAPFVRMHATRDYFELADIIQRYPNVHMTAVLSPTLLWQIQEIYVKRMEPYIKKNKSMRQKPADMDANGFLSAMRGKTDPWIDICLTPAERLTDADKAHLYKNQWNAFTISPVRLNRFPELLRLYEKWKDAKGNPTYTVQELRTMKFFAIFAHFDSEFYERSVPLIQTGTRIKLALDLRDLISYRSDGKYYLKNEVTEDHCRRIVASAYHIMASILPNFIKVKYNDRAKVGQMELAATSYSDAVLPLMINSDVAKEANPGVTLPPTYSHPEDADAQLKMSIAAYQKYFNHTPSIYVAPYGAMSAPVVPLLKKNGFQWFVSHENVLKRSQPGELEATQPYSVTVDGATMQGAFANDLLNTRVNWIYRNYYGENSSDDFVRTLLSMAPAEEDKDILVTVVFDNDDAWMNYVRDTDGKGLVNGIYRKIMKLFQSRAVISVTLDEYVNGNRERGIPPHKVADYTSLSTLAAGSRFDGNFNPWIGDEGSNAAWSALKTGRDALKGAPATGPEYLDAFASQPFNFFYGATSHHWYQAFNSASILRDDPKPFEQVFTRLLRTACEKAGVAAPSLGAIVPAGTALPAYERTRKSTRVTFRSKLVDREAITSVFIAGNRKELANLEPNTTRMWDNGENGDEVFGNNIWTLVIDIESGELIYKYSNSGGQGTWEGSETFPDQWRKVMIEGDKMTIDDIFAKLPKTGEN